MSTPRPRRGRSRNAGGARAARPTPGWKGNRLVSAWSNPRPPSVPSTMDLRLEEYYAGAALVGVLSSQADEPDTQWACEWAWEMGKRMAREATKRRRKG